MIFVKHSLYRCFFIFQGFPRTRSAFSKRSFFRLSDSCIPGRGVVVKVSLNERISTAIAAILPAVIQSCLILRCRFCRIYRCSFSFRPSGISIGPRSPKIGSPGSLPVARQTSTPALPLKLSPLCNIVSVLLPYILSVIFHFASFLLPSTVRVRATPGCGWRLVL